MAEAIIAEIKAVYADPLALEKALIANGAVYKGLDHQVDTYFVVPSGRLKLREGSIENTLIYYHRVEVNGIKSSEVKYVSLNKDQVQGMKDLLAALHETLVVVDKQRKIYFIDNVKFHIDEVEQLGAFVEIEAIGDKGQDYQVLTNQCQSFMDLFGITESDCIDSSYSDLLLKL